MTKYLIPLRLYEPMGLIRFSNTKRFVMHRAVAITLIGGCIFIYSGSPQLVSFEIKLTSKEVSQA